MGEKGVEGEMRGWQSRDFSANGMINISLFFILLVAQKQFSLSPHSGWNKIFFLFLILSLRLHSHSSTKVTYVKPLPLVTVIVCLCKRASTMKPALCVYVYCTAHLIYIRAVFKIFGGNIKSHILPDCLFLSHLEQISSPLEHVPVKSQVLQVKFQVI